MPIAEGKKDLILNWWDKKMKIKGFLKKKKLKKIKATIVACKVIWDCFIQYYGELYN